MNKYHTTAFMFYTILWTFYIFFFIFISSALIFVALSSFPYPLNLISNSIVSHWPVPIRQVVRIKVQKEKRIVSKKKKIISFSLKPPCFKVKFKNEWNPNLLTGSAFWTENSSLLNSQRMSNFCWLQNLMQGTYFSGTQPLESSSPSIIC